MHYLRFALYISNSQVNQKKSKFAFGTAVRADIIMDPSQTAYHDFVYQNFEWVTIANRLKWRLMEFTQVRVFGIKGVNIMVVIKDIVVESGEGSLTMKGPSNINLLCSQ